MSEQVVLAIESSCDETAAALVGRSGRIYGQVLASQIETHRVFGGVVPEVASRGHFAALDALVEELLRESLFNPRDVSAIAATCGPGLVGPLLVGSSYAQGLAAGWARPFIGVHHLRGHLASSLLDPQLGDDLKARAESLFPALVLLVSGGHTQVLEVDAGLGASKLADTADDAAGECFDKSAKLMGLPYPGGPALETRARTLAESDRPWARELYVSLPKPRSQEGYSFSGLKTAIRLKLQAYPALKDAPAFAWAVQEAIAETLLAGLKRSVAETLGYKSLVFCGGVAANLRIREKIGGWAQSEGLRLVVPPLRYCTDNAVMIAAAALVQDPRWELPSVVARFPLEK